MIKKKILFFFTVGLCFCRCEYSFSELNFKASLLKIDPVTSAVEKYLLESPYSASQSLTETNNNLYLSGIVFSPLPSYYQWITDLNGKVTKKTLLLSSEITDILLVPVTSNNSSVFLSIENQLFTSDLNGNITGPVEIYQGANFIDNLFLDTNSNLYFAGYKYFPEEGFNSAIVVQTTDSGDFYGECLVDEPGAYYGICKNNSTISGDLTTVDLITAGVSSDKAFLTLWDKNIAQGQDYVTLSSNNSAGYSVTSFGNKAYTLGIDSTVNEVVVWSYDNLGNIEQKTLYESQVPFEDLGVTLGTIINDGNNLYLGFTIPTGLDTSVSFFYILDSNMNILKSIPMPERFVIADLILKNNTIYVAGFDYSLSQEQLFFEAVRKYSPLKFQKGSQ